ncbi:hypothetical protein AB0N09_13825 [Streptomyces erythrochromogenes]|uniref:hypothetical protein n=1 Tax=Streptomyces erythrochromogenes TaxID=285574 RepID=UPI003419BEF8
MSNEPYEELSPEWDDEGLAGLHRVLMAALPSLVPDELDGNRSPAEDPCALPASMT